VILEGVDDRDGTKWLEPSPTSNTPRSTDQPSCLTPIQPVSKTSQRARRGSQREQWRQLLGVPNRRSHMARCLTGRRFFGGTRVGLPDRGRSVHGIVGVTDLCMFNTRPVGLRDELGFPDNLLRYEVGTPYVSPWSATLERNQRHHDGPHDDDRHEHCGECQVN
jgi:hypothetical protein